MSNISNEAAMMYNAPIHNDLRAMAIIEANSPKYCNIVFIR